MCYFSHLLLHSAVKESVSHLPAATLTSRFGDQIFQPEKEKQKLYVCVLIKRISY